MRVSFPSPSTTLKKNLNAFKPSERPPPNGKGENWQNVKVGTYAAIYNVGEKPTFILYTSYIINRRMQVHQTKQAPTRGTWIEIEGV